MALQRSRKGDVYGGRMEKRQIRAHVAQEKNAKGGDTASGHRNDVEAAGAASEKPQKPSLFGGGRSNGSGGQQQQQQEKDGVHDDRFLVRLTAEEDPLDPQNWSRMSRAKNIAILTFLIFTLSWAGTSSSQGNLLISTEFRVSQVAQNLSTAMYLFGVGSGSLFAGPISESVGRNPTYLVTSFAYLFFVLGSARTPNFAGQVVCRFFVGLFASATLAINGSSVGDQFRPVKRTFVFPIVAWANVAGPTIAPIVGGWVVSNARLGWRWTEYITLIVSGVAWVVAFFFLPETYTPILLDWKAKELRRVTGDRRYVSEHAGKASLLRRMREILPRSMVFFFTEPVVTVLGIYLILLYIILFTFMSGFDYIFKQTYGLSTAHTGSCFGAIAVGEALAILAAPALYGWARHMTGHRRGAGIAPEFRLWPAIFAAPLLPVSLFWLGWTNYRTISIWSNLGACLLFGVVLVAIYTSSYEYIIDSYGDHAASALASITMFRYLVSGGMVMATRPMYVGIGVHWTLTLLGCLSVILLPMPWVFHKYGEKLRERSPYAKHQTKVHH